VDKGALKEAIQLFVFDFGYVPLDIRILNNESMVIHFSIFKKNNISLKDCSRVTLAVKEFLVNLLGTDDFILDVSSPGAERVLKSPLEFAIFEGKKVKIIFKDGSIVKGILKGLTIDGSRVCFTDLSSNSEKDVSFADVSKCQLTLE
jgi:ribosome maturation factor RimP